MIMDIVPNKSVSSHQTQLYQKMLFFFSVIAEQERNTV